MNEHSKAQDTQEKIMERPPEDGYVSNGDKGSKGKKKFLLPALLLLVAACVGGGYWWYTQNQVMDATTKYWFDRLAKDGSLEGKTPSEVQGILNSVVEEGMFNVSINAKVVFHDTTSEGSLGMENIPENRYYSRVVIRRNDTNEVIYESRGLKPGQYLDKIKLKQRIPAGSYDCTAQIIATDPESLDDVGQVQVEILVAVLN